MSYARLKAAPEPVLPGGKREAKRSRVDCLFLRRICLLFARFTGRTEALLLIVLIMIAWGNQVLVYFVGLTPSRLIEGLLHRDVNAFLHVLWQAALYTVSEAILLSLITMLAAYLSLRWRRNLTMQLHARYVVGRQYFDIAHFHQTDIDNPDQRVVEDTRNLTEGLAEVIRRGVVLPALVVFYTVQVSRILGWIGPVTIYVYFVIGSIINKLLMGRVASAVWAQEKLEGNFRYAHTRLRVNAEAVAIYNGARHERSLLTNYLDAVLDNTLVLIKRRCALDVSSNMFSYVGAIIHYGAVGLGLAYGVFDHIADPAEFARVINESAFLSIMLIHSFSEAVNLSSVVADLAGYVSRVAEMSETLENDARQEGDDEEEVSENDLHSFFPVDNDKVPPNYHHSGGEKDGDEDVLSLDSVVCETPEGAVLSHNSVSFRLRAGESLLIQGSSGCGKSSLVRQICGLWPVRTGIIKTPPAERFFVLPQEPYLIIGTLSEQVSYPTEDSVSETKLAELLRHCQLSYLLKRYDPSEVKMWHQILSPGEQQKLAFARLLYHEPKVAILDESTSALGVADERKMYMLLKERNIGYLSIGHRPSLLQYHQSTLQFGDE